MFQYQSLYLEFVKSLCSLPKPVQNGDAKTAAAVALQQLELCRHIFMLLWVFHAIVGFKLYHEAADGDWLHHERDFGGNFGYFLYIGRRGKS